MSINVTNLLLQNAVRSNHGSERFSIH